MPFSAFFDGPNHYPAKMKFYDQGGSPKLLDHLIEVIEAQKNEIVEINIAWYLYNNQYLHRYLKSLSIEGITINVITIPLEGYDHSKPKKLTDLSTGQKKEHSVTKYELAKEIFGEMYRTEAYPNFNLYFFSHLFVRSPLVKKFSRGSFPYSLHLKSAYIKKKKGCCIILSSSNLAVRDIVKHESLVCIQDEEQYEESFKNFYSDLISNSIHVKNYKREDNTTCNTFNFIASKDTLPHSFITAPFYFDSSNRLEEVIIHQVSIAKERVIICAQHLAAFNYWFNARYHSVIKESKIRGGVIGKLVKKAKEGVNITCLSQTFAPPAGREAAFEGISFRQPVNKRNFQEAYEALTHTENATYYVNQDLHSKYIIIDNKLIYCTYNFTPTQFTYLDRVNISKFKEMPDTGYQGTHCEVAAHVVIEEKTIVDLFVKNIEMVKALENTIRVL